MWKRDATSPRLLDFTASHNWIDIFQIELYCGRQPGKRARSAREGVKPQPAIQRMAHASGRARQRTRRSPAQIQAAPTERQPMSQENANSCKASSTRMAPTTKCKPLDSGEASRKVWKRGAALTNERSVRRAHKHLQKHETSANEPRNAKRAHTRTERR